MKKTSILIASIVATIAIFASKPLFAGGIEVSVSGCFETGNIQDLCLFSDGEQSIYITKCKPGNTTCGYTYP